MGRKPSPEKIAARRVARVEMMRRAVDAELRRGDLRTALRLVMGFAEDVALASDQAEAVYMLQFNRNGLAYRDQDKVSLVWQKVLSDALGEMGLWLKEKGG